MPFCESKWPNDLEGQGQFSISAAIIPRCIFGVNLVILAQIHQKLICVQAEIPRIMSQNGLDGQGQWPPFSIPAESIPECMFGANLMIAAQTYDELSCGQAQFPSKSILSKKSQNALEGQGQWPFFSIPTESIPWCMFGANLVNQLKSVTSYRADKVKFTDRRTDGRTDRQTDRRTDAGNDNTPSASKANG